MLSIALRGEQQLGEGLLPVNPGPGPCFTKVSADTRPILQAPENQQLFLADSSNYVNCSPEIRSTSKPDPECAWCMS